MDVDAVVVGSGPNGLAAALTMAAAGLRVQVIEGAPSIGGGCRTEELTLPGFWHDVCSAAHPLAVASPFFKRFDLAARGVTLRPARGGVRPPAGRGPGRGRDPLGRRDRRQARCRRPRLPAPARPADQPHGRRPRGDPGPAAHAARASAGRRELRPPGHPAGLGGGQAVGHRRGPGDHGRRRGARDDAADRGADRGRSG